MIKILVHCSIYFDGTSFYRGLGPYSHLRKQYPDIEIIDGSTEGSVYDWAKVLQADILFMQRPSQAHEVTIMKLAKSAKIPVLSDYDDDYLNIPATNPRYSLYMNETRQAIIRECLELADHITVSTPAIQDAYAQVVSKNKISVVPNGYDNYLFSDQPYLGKREKVIVWRGGDTHESDLLLVKDQLLRLIKKNPDYRWAFIGYTPRWIASDLEIPAEQLMFFTFQDILHYFNTLSSLRPEIAVVPLEDNLFNHGKSNISALEFTLAGAVTVAPDWDKFQATDSVLYKDPDHFEQQVSALISSPKEVKRRYSGAIEAIQKFSLAEVNKIRYGIIRELLNNSTRRFYPKINKEKPFGDRDYYEHCLKRGMTQESEGYAKAHHALADWLIARLDPDSAVDFGCGPGAIVERLLQQNVKCWGLDKNQYFIEYFRTRNPVHEERVDHVDFTVDELKLDKPFDLAISVNSFENIEGSDEWWGNFLKLLSEKFRYLYLVASPYYSGGAMDQRLNHVNIRRVEKWRELFEANGWKFLEIPNQLVAYDQLFKSTTLLEESKRQEMKVAE